MADKDIFLKKLGRNIDRIRKEKGLSFRELSIRCDIEKSNLVKLSRSGSNITVSTLYKISQGLEVPVKDLFDFPPD